MGARRSTVESSDAVRAVAKSQVELADAVGQARLPRLHGHTWRQIAVMLGTSRQVAQERYGGASRASGDVTSRAYRRSGVRFGRHSGAGTAYLGGKEEKDDDK